MSAVFKHELRMYFRSLTAYVFGAFLLAFVGLGAMLYNIQAAVSNFEFVLSFSSLGFVVIVPILTMRVIAEEKKQKTDQLILTSPVSIGGIVAGKYLAMATVFTLPVAVMALFPLILSRYGTVPMGESYTALLAYYLFGLTCLAIGLFISSITESQIIAAVLSFALLFVG